MSIRVPYASLQYNIYNSQIIDKNISKHRLGSHLGTKPFSLLLNLPNNTSIDSYNRMKSRFESSCVREGKKMF